MKYVVGWICLGALYAGTVLVEYVILRFGAVVLLFAAASAVAVLSSALYHAPEAYEQADGLHVRRGTRVSGFLRLIRPFQRGLRRGWT
jgi:hypothetical protein